MANSKFSGTYYDGMTAQHIATNLNKYEAARSGFFVFKVDDLTNLLKTNFQGGVGDDDAEFMDSKLATEGLMLNVTQASVPSYSVEDLTFVRGNDIVHFAGKPNWQGGSITVDDIVGMDTKSILMAWLRNAYDPHTFKGGRMENYKKTCTLMEYTQDYELIRTWTLYGCFITGLTEDAFNKESDGKRAITANFVYDRAIMELPEEETE